MNVKALKKQLMAAIAMVLVAAVALSSATYAWFVNNAQVTATNASVQAATAYSLLISKDGTNFGTTTAFTKELTKLTPVSTIGTKQTASGSVESDAYDANDLRFVTSTQWSGNVVTDYKEVTKNSSITASGVTSNYYYTDTVYLKAAQDGKIYIDKDTVANTTGITYNDIFYTIPNFINANSSSDSTLAAAQQFVKTLRIGFVITDTTASNVDKGTHVYQLHGDKIGTGSDNTTFGTANGINKAAGKFLASPQTFYTLNGTQVYKNTDDKFYNTSNFTGAPLTDAQAANVVTTTSSITIDSVGFSNSASGVPVITDVSAQGSQTSPATTIGATALIDGVKANHVYKVDTYIWMEGCDYDVIGANLELFQNGLLNNLSVGFCWSDN